jgi:hypothetical protein
VAYVLRRGISGIIFAIEKTPLPKVSLTLTPTLSRTKQERELRSVACVMTFQAVQKVSSFRRLALQEQAGPREGS